MKSAIFMEKRRFTETEFKSEEEFEKLVKENSKTLFGNKIIYFEIKNKVDTKVLGATTISFSTSSLTSLTTSQSFG